MTRASILAFDCAGASCSAAVYAGGAVRAGRFEAMARGQSERLVPLIQEVMFEAGLDYGGLDAIAVTRGPGGFTGVRIGLATARGLALASGRPVVGVTNFEAVAAAVPAAAGRSLLVALETKREDLYVQSFGRGPDDGPWRPSAPAASLRAQDLADYADWRPSLLAGDAVARLERDFRIPAGWDAELSAKVREADAAVVARLVAGRPIPDNPGAPAPVYLRAPDVSLPT